MTQKEKILESTHLPKELWDKCIVTEEGQVFTPNTETGTTSEEEYNKYLSNIGKYTPSQIEILANKIDGLENINAGLLLENAEHQIKIQGQEKMNKEQEVTNANLLLEIAMLKGVKL